MPADLAIEVVFALPDEQRLASVSLPDGATVQDAIDASGLVTRFPDESIDSMQVGVWGRVVDREHALKDGDRVEIYRPLLLDPREARRRLAAAGKTMGRPADD